MGKDETEIEVDKKQEAMINAAPSFRLEVLSDYL
jgi:hypothetical protein